MIRSKAVGLLRNFSRPHLNKKLSTVTQASEPKHGEWTYRKHTYPPKWQEGIATGIVSIMWWWVYWNLYHEWEHLLGLNYGSQLPDPRKWTDEELGIPPLP